MSLGCVVRFDWVRFGLWKRAFVFFWLETVDVFFFCFLFCFFLAQLSTLPRMWRAATGLYPSMCNHRFSRGGVRVSLND